MQIEKQYFIDNSHVIENSAWYLQNPPLEVPAFLKLIFEPFEISILLIVFNNLVKTDALVLIWDNIWCEVPW